jgi:hypothetical protein
MGGITHATTPGGMGFLDLQKPSWGKFSWGRQSGFYHVEIQHPPLHNSR